MRAGLPKYLPVNLKDIADAGFQDGEEVSLESLKKKGLINPSGRERRLPLKVMYSYMLKCWVILLEEVIQVFRNRLKQHTNFISFMITGFVKEATYVVPYHIVSAYYVIYIILLLFQILGDGDLTVKLDFKARAFSASAKEKIEAAGCSLTVLPGRKKWVKPSVAKNLTRAEEYFAKKRASADWVDTPSA